MTTVVNSRINSRKLCESCKLHSLLFTKETLKNKKMFLGT